MVPHNFRRGLKAAVLRIRSNLEQIVTEDEIRCRIREAFFFEIAKKLLARFEPKAVDQWLCALGHSPVPELQEIVRKELIGFDFLKRILSTSGQVLSDEILAWLYQYWNTPERDSATWAVSRGTASGISDQNCSFATQLYTEPYMGDFLAKRCLAAWPTNQIDTLSLMDPACGGGNILLSMIRELHGRIGHRCLEMLKGGRLKGADIDPFACIVARASLFLFATQIESNVEVLSELISGLNSSIFTVPSPYGSLLRDCHSALCVEAVDVLITNPPFIGRRKLDGGLRDFLTHHYPGADGDLAAAFIVRCMELLNIGGQLGIVSNDKWLRLRGYQRLRWSLSNSPGVFSHTSVQSLIELGARAFHREADLHDGVGVALLHTERSAPPAEHSLLYANLAGVAETEEKERVLASESLLEEIAQRIPQRDLETPDVGTVLLKESNSCFKYFSNGRPLDDAADVIVGLQTNDDRTFVAPQWSIPVGSDGWVVHNRGGGTLKWYGLNRWMLHLDGVRKRLRSGRPFPVERWFERSGWTYSWFASGVLALRQKEAGWSFGRAAASGVFTDDLRIVAFLNSPLGSLIASRLSGKVQLPEGVVRRIPIPRELSAIDVGLVTEIVDLAKQLALQDPREVGFRPDKLLAPHERCRLEEALRIRENQLLRQVSECIGCDEEYLRGVSRLDPLQTQSEQVVMERYLYVELQSAILQLVGHVFRGQVEQGSPVYRAVSLESAERVLDERLDRLISDKRIPDNYRSLKRNLRHWIVNDLSRHHASLFAPFPLLSFDSRRVAHSLDR